MPELGRLLTAMVTPFNEEGMVDYEQAKKLALALLDSGSDGVAVAAELREGPGADELRHQVGHQVALRGAHAREANAGEAAQVLPDDRPGPLPLDLVHLLEPVQKQGGPESARGIQARRGGGQAHEETGQQRDQDDRGQRDPPTGLPRQPR